MIENRIKAPHIRIGIGAGLQEEGYEAEVR